MVEFAEPSPSDLLEYQKVTAVPLSQLYATLLKLQCADWVDEHGVYHCYLQGKTPPKERQAATTERYNTQLALLKKHAVIDPLKLNFQGDRVRIDDGRHRLAALKAYSTEIGRDVMVLVLLRKMRDGHGADYRDFVAPERFPAWLASATPRDE